jgi:hypothetical protein
MVVEVVVRMLQDQACLEVLAVAVEQIMVLVEQEHLDKVILAVVLHPHLEVFGQVMVAEAVVLVVLDILVSQQHPLKD